jgi:hypothetical protein
LREIIPSRIDYSMGRENETDGWLKIFEIVIGNRPCYTTCKMDTPDVHPVL